MSVMVYGLNNRTDGSDKEIEYRTIMRIYAEGRTFQEAEDIAGSVIEIVKKS